MLWCAFGTETTAGSAGASATGSAGASATGSAGACAEASAAGSAGASVVGSAGASVVSSAGDASWVLLLVSGDTLERALSKQRALLSVSGDSAPNSAGAEAAGCSTSTCGIVLPGSTPGGEPRFTKEGRLESVSATKSALMKGCVSSWEGS